MAFLQTSCHVLSLLTTPVNLFGTYCIITKSNSNMSTIRNTLLQNHLWASLSDLVYGFLVIPYATFPISGAIVTSTLTWLGVPEPAQIYLITLVISGYGASVVMVFENRQNHVVPVSKFKIESKITRRLFYFLNYVYVFGMPMCMFISTPDQEEAKVKMFERVPCPSIEFFSDHLYILSNSIIVGFVQLGSTTIIIVLTLFYVLHCFIYLFSVKTISRRTRQLQIKFFLCVAIQVSVPFVVCACPFLYFIFATFFNYYNQVVLNFSIIALSLQGYSSTCFMLLIYEPYRNFVFSFLPLHRIPLFKAATVSVVSEPTLSRTK
ncbi:unnamed protein product [Caenorhabditis bovis]|uniref:Uncharacterized protein n=1 Tax=Caenorhabditis bovis TaxID=2654633 RepID=A0A8S1E7J1_9PELO|nr:unnamed protein product [Caenorhabditis bovis]